MGLKGEVQVGCLEKFFLSKSSEALEQTAYGGSGVTIPGGVQKLWRCGPEGHDHWAWWDGLGLDLEISELFSSLHDSMVLLNLLFLLSHC